MTSSSIEYWFIGSQSLNTFAYSVTTVGGTPRSLPVARGQDIQVSYIPGQLFRPKFPDSRVITLAMFCAAIDPSTSKPTTGDALLQFNNNWRSLQRLFYNLSGQFALTRQWYYTVSGVPTMVQATAMAQTAGNMEMTMNNRYSGSFAIDLLLSDPYFYGNTVSTTNVSTNSPTTVTNPGDDLAAYNSCSVTFNGPLSYPRLTNSTLNPVVWFQLNTIIASGDSVTFDCANFNAVRASDGLNLTGTVSHSGARRWMGWAPGANTLTLTSTNPADIGTTSFSFVPPYC